MAAGPTYYPLATYTVSGTTTASYTFNAISSAYTDLRVVFNGGGDGNLNLAIQYNGDTGTNYSYTFLTGNTANASASKANDTTTIFTNYYGYLDTNYTTNIGIDIFNYSNTTTYKSNVSRANNPSNGVAAVAGMWRSTAAITSIKLLTGGNFLAGSTITLYGIKAA